jgi:DNA segregation ATPase FtsK/SpoIIIE-like protein
MGGTRRHFLALTAGAAGAAALGARVPARAVAAVAPGSAATLTAQRRRTYAALIEAVAPEDPFRLDPSVAGAAADELAERYAAWGPAARARADRVLDALGPAFVRSDRARRARWLRDRSRARSHTPAGRERDALDLAERALALAAVTLGPDDDAGSAALTL